MSCLKDRILLDGASQHQRLPLSLKEGYVKIDDLTEEQYYAYIRKISSAIIYYNSNNLPDKTWEGFLPPNWMEFISSSAQKPHLALLQLFLKIYIATIQRDLNRLPGKHLHYVYRNILGFTPGIARPDQVFVYFQLNKDADSAVMPRNTRLSGVHPVSGLPLAYTVDREIVLNRAEIVRYQTIYTDRENGEIFAAPIANSADGIGKPLASGNHFWPAFGSSQRDKSIADRTMQEARIGFAFSSPLLFLTEGQRTIEMVLNFDQDLPADRSRLRAWCSGEKGWEGPYVPVVGKQGKELKVVLSLPHSAPSVLPFTNGSNPTGFDTLHPFVLLEMDPSIQNGPYEMVFAHEEKKLIVENYRINVVVDGMKNQCIIENGLMSIIPNKPFQLFGPVPVNGTVFKVRCPELRYKEWSRLSILFNWLDLPFYFSEHYAGYTEPGDPVVAENNYKLNAISRIQGKWKAWNDLLLFARTNIVGPIPFRPISFPPNNAGVDRPDFFPAYPDEVLEATLQVSGSLSAFGHQEFPNVLSRRVIEISNGNTDPLPLPPYTPAIKDFSLGYESSETMETGAIRFYQVQPFGARQVDGKGFPLFPNISAPGYLHIGLKHLTPGQSLSLLFVFAEGSHSGNLDENFSVHWQYLRNNEWKNMDPELVTGDSTDNWQQPGIISLSIPFDIDAENTLAEKGIYWLRASLLTGKGIGRRLSIIHPQAVLARYDDALSETGGWNGAIPAQTLKDMEPAIPAIKKLVQPLSSFGGYTAETDADLKARAAERLRHKNRGVQYWDYERLVLLRFPQLFKVKCLFHSGNTPSKSPGKVTLVTVPFVRHGSLEERLEPRTAPQLQRQIKSYIQSRTSAWVDVNVEDPVYEQILLDFKVRFNTGLDPAVYRTRLEEDIYRFLAPWAFDESRDQVFENRIHRSAIIYYLERLSYVNFITNLKMYHAYEGPSLFGIGCMEIETDFIVWEQPVPALGEMIIETDFIVGFESDLAIATTARSILVSALSHRIEVLHSDTPACPGLSASGIGAMAVERDFIIGQPC